jgi:hypothetical protein
MRDGFLSGISRFKEFFISRVIHLHWRGICVLGQPNGRPSGFSLLTFSQGRRMWSVWFF